MNEEGEIVVRADKLEAENIKAASIDATNLSSNSLTTTDFSSTTSSLGRATSTILNTNNLNSSTSSIGDSIATSFEIQEKINALSVPIGTILPFIGESAPDGYLICNGQTLDGVSDERFYKLYDVIETKFGGTSRANYQVPDLNGYFLRGASSPTSVGTFQSDATAVNGLSQYTTRNGAHKHANGDRVHENDKDRYHYGTTYLGSNVRAHINTSDSTGTRYLAWTSRSDTHNHSISSTDEETRPKNMSVNYIIKY